ncbi:MAG TPA: LpqN/LpqT family lipoprotein [Mycobacterium sp.]|nr:LpqN/LpqT family lipoprotein [Mycobacterium sp.]HEX4587397.1 LpqN/LpqT family lipoprotein [Mycobacterium sp.]
MRAIRRAVAVALVVLAATGCGAETPDYKSVWSTSATTTTPTAAGAAAVPLAKFLEDAGVKGEPVAPQKLPDLTVTMPQPKGWEQYNNPNFAPGTQMIAKGDTYPTAILVVLTLTGDFDVNEAIKHGYVDAQLSQNFKQLNASTDNWKGFPSSMIEGSYDLNGRRMHSYNRIVIPTGAPPANQRYLVQFTVTGYAEKAADEAPDIEAVIAGFDVAVPKAAPK